MIIAMIPARMGSQRLKQKNLQKIEGVPIISHAIRKALASRAFDEVWVNSEHNDFKQIAETEGVYFHDRPVELANNQATSEEYVYEFLKKHPCNFLVQIHSIAPLLKVSQVSGFVEHLRKSDFDMLVSVVEEQIECAYQDKPINFSFEIKTNSQELRPIQRVTWSITAWRAETYINAYESNQCATYAGKVGFYPVDRLAGHIIKTSDDLEVARALYPMRYKKK